MWDKNYEDPCLAVGRKFKDVEEFRLYLRQFNIKHNFNCCLQKNDGKDITTKCADEVCKWHVRAARISYEVTYEVRVFQEKYNCIWVNKAENDDASGKWIARHLVNIRDNSYMTPTEIVNLIDRKYSVLVLYKKAWREREIARERIF